MHQILDRLTKGVREAPSKALVGELAHSCGDSAAAAFGVRQSLSTLGMLLGSVAAGAAFQLTGRSYTATFALSAVPALAGFGLVLAALGRDAAAADAARRQAEEQAKGHAAKIIEQGSGFPSDGEIVYDADVVAAVDERVGAEADPREQAPHRQRARVRPSPHRRVERYLQRDDQRRVHREQEAVHRLRQVEAAHRVDRHSRLPGYALGRVGVIEQLHGAHVFADAHAQGLGEQPQWLYAVAFDAAELWGDAATPGSSVSLDAWESYLEPAA